MAHRRIPVVVVTGFLGSGKTTLLNHLLANSAGTRIGVVVNDFGQINIDAMTVAGQVDSMVSLGNGCLCCAVDASDLDEMLTKLAEPRARIDVIVIEASGLAEPQSIVRMLLFSENPAIAYGGLVEVVDAAEFGASRERHPELDRHLRFADLVVLNKTDRVADLAPIRAVIDSLSLGKPVLPVSHGAVDPALLFDQVVRPDDAARQLSFDELLLESDDHSQHAHALYSSVSFSSVVPMHPQRFARFLDERPAGLYRLKGSVYFGVPGHSGKFSVQTVGGYLRFSRSGWARGESCGTELVMIGTELDAPLISKRLESCQHEAGETVSADSMLAVLRYLE